jgi:hypothetical protein
MKRINTEVHIENINVMKRIEIKLIGSIHRWISLHIEALTDRNAHRYTNRRTHREKRIQIEALTEKSARK